MAIIMDPKKFLVQHQKKFLDRKFLISTFTYQRTREEFSSVEELKTALANGAAITSDEIFILTEGKIQYYAYISKRTVEELTIGYISNLTKDKTAPVAITMPLTVLKGDIENVYTSTPIKSTVGRFLLNYILLVDTFGKEFEYINDVIDNNKIEKGIVKLFIDKTIDADAVYKYVSNLYYIGHFTQLAVPSFTKKSFVTDPNMAKYKKQLIEKYKDQLDDPVIINKIEDALIAKDKEFVGKDDAMRFYGPMGKKPFNIHRKKMFLSVGGVAEFSDDSTSTEFIQNSLAEGWDMENFDMMVDEIRKGSYSRGKDTALGGELTKYILRIFQDVMFIDKDCKSKQGQTIKITEEYVGRTIVGGGKLTEANIKSYIGKNVKLRSAMACKETRGICNTCIGDKVAALGHKTVLGMAIQISGTIMGLSMKNMHGTKLATEVITSIDHWVYK